MESKLGPLLWLYYVNDLGVDWFCAAEYADDTSFYMPVFHRDQDTLAPKTIAVEKWLRINFISLNAQKTEIINISLNYRHIHKSKGLVK